MNPENLKCPSCAKIFAGKVFVLHCGHSFCLECIHMYNEIALDNPLRSPDQEYYNASLCCPCCKYENKIDTRKVPQSTKVYTLTRSGRYMATGLLMAHGYFPRNRIVETMAQEYR